jgi:large subunit ribosomal protein L3
MSLGMLGNKIGMSQIPDEFGNLTSVTILYVGSCVITQIKTIQTDGYNAIQLGSNMTLFNKLKKPQQGHYTNKSINMPLKYLHEYRVNTVTNFMLGQLITIDLFQDMNFVNVTGKDIGKGFAGNQKRHNFSRGPMTHGSKNHREPGSIGAGTTPGRVIPGKKMAGQLGGQKITTKNLEIIKICRTENLLLVKGSIPGKPGNLVSIHFFK